MFLKAFSIVNKSLKHMQTFAQQQQQEQRFRGQEVAIY
jgi:hypothetical protein